MGENLLSVFNDIIKKTGNENDENKISADDIVSLSYNINKRNGQKIAKATLANGTSYVQTLTPSGVKIGNTIQIPSYNGAVERSKIVHDLNEHYTQDEIASFLQISQSTVHNDIKKYNPNDETLNMTDKINPFIYTPPCPNCGSFDVQLRAQQYECNSCKNTWKI